jgi:hypothetical protein
MMVTLAWPPPSHMVIKSRPHEQGFRSELTDTG